MERGRGKSPAPVDSAAACCIIKQMALKSSTYFAALFLTLTTALLATNSYADDSFFPSQSQSQQQQQRQRAQQKTQTQKKPASKRYYRIYVGALAGLGVPGGGESQLGTKLAFGVTGVFKVNREWGFGAYYLHSSGSFTQSGVSTSVGIGLMGLEVDYFTRNGFSFGARAGLTSLSVTETEQLGTLAGSVSPISFGPHISYDHRINRSPFTVGGDVSAMFVESAATAVDPTTGYQISTPFFSVLTGMVTLKYWF
jgi:hypothetical protein